MSYVDGFVLAVPRKNLAKYKKIASAAAKQWMKLGATAYVECVGDDVPPGKLTSFPMAVKAKKDEVVCFSWIVYPNKATRDRINKIIMSDPDMPKEMPFDMKRMIYGGFKPIVER